MKFLRWFLKKRLQLVLTVLAIAVLFAVTSSARFDPGLPRGTDSSTFTTARVNISTAATLTLAQDTGRNYHTFYSTYTDFTINYGSSAETCDIPFINASHIKDENTAAYYMQISSPAGVTRAYMYIEAGK